MLRHCGGWGGFEVTEGIGHAGGALSRRFAPTSPAQSAGEVYFGRSNDLDCFARLAMTLGRDALYERVRAPRTSSRAAGSSMVGGTATGSPSAMRRIEARRILPDRVLGRRGTTRASLKAATGPMRSRTNATSSLAISASGRFTPAFRT